MELEPRHRRGREAAGGRDADQLRELVRHRVALEGAHDARCDDEDRGDRCERELEACVEQRVGVPAEKKRRADEQRLPAVPFTGGEPGERPEPGGQCRPHDRRMEPHREGVGRDAEQRRDLRDVATEAGEQAERRDTAAHGGHLQPVHGEAVVEAGRSEVRQEPLVEARRTTEDDRLDHAPPVPAEAGSTVSCEPAPHPVADAGDAAPPADDTPRLPAQDRVNPLPTQPAGLVEAVQRPRRSA